MPTFANIDPVADSTIGAATSLVFDVTDAGGLASVFVYTTFGDGSTEVVWTGDGFGPRYSTSTRVAITDGFTFTINRVGGWQASPMLRAVAISNTATQANLSVDYVLSVPVVEEPRPVVGGEAPSAAAAGRSTVSVVLGTGLVGPFRRDGKGDFANASDVELVQSNVQQILGTIASSDFTVGEVPWRPEFGSLLYLIRFQNNDAILQELASQYVVDALEVWEPRVRIRESRIDQDVEAGVLEIIVIYDILSRRRNVLVSGLQQAFTTQLETAA